MKPFFLLNNSKIKLDFGLAGIAAALLLIGCESGVTNEDTENVLTTSAYTSSQCATAAPVATFFGAYEWTSSTNYNMKCNAIDDTARGTAGYLGYGSSANRLPKSKSACEATQMNSLFYTRIADGSNFGWTLKKLEGHAGVWGPNASGVFGCSMESTSFPPQQIGVLVRVATTLRQPSGTSFITLPFTSFLQ